MHTSQKALAMADNGLPPVTKSPAAADPPRLSPSGHGAIPELTRISRETSAPLSYYQERVWKVDRAQGGTAMYNIPFALRIRGRLDTCALRASLDDFVQRHEAFRTIFLAGNGNPAQRVLETAPAPLEETDLLDLSPDQLEAAMRQLSDTEARRVFELTDRPPIRFHLVRVAADEHKLLVNLHHIIGDGWSLNIMKRELPQLYHHHVSGSAAELPRLPVQYVDYAGWQREWLSGARLEFILEYWRQQLKELPLLEIPTDRPRLATPCVRAGKCFFTIPPEITRRLKEFARRQQATLFMVMSALFALTLEQVAGQSDVTLGAPMANRSRRELSGIFGLFANTVPLRIDLCGAKNLEAAILRTKDAVLGAYQRQEIPYQLLVDRLGPPRPPGRLPFFEVTILETRIVPWPTLGDCKIDALSMAPAIPKYDLALEYWETATELQGKVTYAMERFDEPRIEHLVASLVDRISAAAKRDTVLDNASMT